MEDGAQPNSNPIAPWGQPLFWVGLAGCAAILALRRPDAFAHPQFWAEDGYFFERNYTLGLKAIFLPYAGYLHLVPRLIAVFASLLDPLWIPAAYVGASLLLTLYVAAAPIRRDSPLPRIRSICWPWR
jgi:hypothetical protein